MVKRIKKIKIGLFFYIIFLKNFIIKSKKPENGRMKRINEDC